MGDSKGDIWDVRCLGCPPPAMPPPHGEAFVLAVAVSVVIVVGVAIVLCHRCLGWTSLSGEVGSPPSAMPPPCEEAFIIMTVNIIITSINGFSVTDLTLTHTFVFIFPLTLTATLKSHSPSRSLQVEEVSQ